LTQLVPDGGLVEGTAEDGGDLAYFLHQGREILGEERLHSIGQGHLRLMMDFDEQAIGASRYRGAS
jgi:hypothetical protein